MAHTVGVFGQDGVCCENGLRLAFLVDGRDLELVEMAWFESFGCCVAGGGCACGSPLSGVNVHVSNQVPGDGGAAVVQWRIPAKFDVFSANLIRVQVARFKWHV